MAESTEVVVRRFTQVIDMSLQIQVIKVWSRLTPSVVTVSERFTTEPAILMDVICGNARSLC